MIAYQTVNPKQAGMTDEFYGMPSDTSTKHEFIEAYIGAVDSSGILVNQNLNYGEQTPEYRAYINAHNKAHDIDKSFVEPKVEPFSSKGLYLMKPHSNPNFKIPQAKLINDRSK